VKVCKEVPGKEKIKTTIKAIRRSGHRGTSGLNYLINMIMTDVAYFDAPYHKKKGAPGGLLNPTCTHSVDHNGKPRNVYRAWEGDDGISALQGAINDEYEKQILGVWTRAGFRMKLKMPRWVAEFCGWKIPLKDRKPHYYPVPDIVRMMGQSAYSTAPEAVELGEAITNGCKVVAAKFRSYAALARGLPTFSRYFERCAEFYGGCEYEEMTGDLLRAHKDDVNIIGKCPVECHDYLYDDILSIDFGTLQPPGSFSSEGSDDEEGVLRALGVVTDHEHYISLCDSLSALGPDCTDVDAEAVCLYDYHE
jgi:hypothetical protein